ncbi:MAG: hypothetical protein ACJ75S_06685 [Solirubrobacterales bacterium]
MRSTRLLITFAAVAAVALPTAGAEAASRLSLRIANKAAQKSAANVAKTYSDDLDTTIDSYDLSPCDRAGRRKADCDVTYVLSDGSQCDDTIHIRTSVKGRLKVTADSDDDGGTHTFDDCTDPSDPGTDDGSVDDGTADDPSADPGSLDGSAGGSTDDAGGDFVPGYGGASRS